MQKVVDWYHKHESVISGLILLFLSLLCGAIKWETWREQLSQSLESWFVNNWAYIILLTLLIILIGCSFYLKSQKTSDQLKVSQLEQDLEDAQQAICNIKIAEINNLEWIISQFLRFLFKKLGLRTEHRISLYIYQYDADEFLVVGRHSDNPEFCKFNRRTFNGQEGVIGCAWYSKKVKIKGKIQQVNFNEIIRLPNNNKSYAKNCNALGIDSFKLRMKSRSLLPILIEDNQRKVAIILLESLTDLDSISNEIEIINIVKDYTQFVVDIVGKYDSLQKQQIDFLTKQGENDDV